MRIFLTGATGVIGRRVLPLLVGAGHQVTAIGRSPEKRAALARQGASAVDVDLFAPDTLRSAIAGHDTIINLATHLPSSSLRMMLPRAWRENDRVRREGSANLTTAARGAGATRFIQESFAPIYADGADRWLDESSVVAPARYNRSILDAEQSAARFTSGGGAGVVLRFAAFYGADAFQIRDMIGLVRRGRAPLPGRATAYFSSVSHDDAATAVVAALNVPAGIYNVVDDEPLRRREYFDALAAELHVPPPKLLPLWVIPLMGSMGRLLARSQRISNRKLREATAWRPRYPSVREGFRAVVSELA